MDNTLGNTSKTQIDGNLLSSLVSEGVQDADARELARMDAFGGAAVQAWIRGLRAAASLLNKSGLVLDWGALPHPWDMTCPELVKCNGSGQDQALLCAVSTYGWGIQAALIGAIGAVAQQLTRQETKTTSTHSSVVGGRPIYLKPIDADFLKTIRSILERKGNRDQKRKKAGEALIEWLVCHGDFIRTIYGGYYYLYRATRRLFTLTSKAWDTFLYLLTSVNPASTDFRYLLADCETASHEGKEMNVVRVSHWDAEQQLLRVSRFDGTVYRLDGMTIEEEANGDGPALFDDASHWQPYLPDYSMQGNVLNWTFRDIPRWESDADECGLLYKAWWLATFFTELCPTRPILTIRGEKGSGKSMMLRIVLRVLFGVAVDVVGVPDRADAFVALTSNSHIVALDNMDTMTRDIRDKIAAMSTGKTDQVRELYTTNESHTIQYRCWLAVTSRTPDTLQRDDLVDRIIMLPVCRIEDNDRMRESLFLAEVMQRRNQWWGDILSALNSVVAEIRRSGVPDRGGLRMEDWAALGTVVARADGQNDLWETGLKRVKVRQAEFLLEGDVIVQSIEAWLLSVSHTSQAIPARDLYEGAKSALFGVDRPDSNWPKSVRSFGRRLAGIRRELRDHLAKSGVQMSWSMRHNQEYYAFVKTTQWAYEIQH